MDYAKLLHQYLFALLITIRQIFSYVRKLKDSPIFVPIGDFLLSLYYYYYCGLSPCTVDLDDETTLHVWISGHRRHDRPNLVLIHGCGGDARWQFFRQMKSLSESFNIYMPDLLFFGKSYTKAMDRSPRFQAKCLMEGLKRGFGVTRCSVYSISYGGWVGYWTAEMYPEEVEKSVIVSTGIGATADQMLEELNKIGVKNVQEIVVPRAPDGLRLLARRSMHKYDYTTWLPDFFLREFIRHDKYMKEKDELIEYVMKGEEYYQLRTPSQETLLVWGEEDNVFPKHFAYQLQRLLGPQVRLEMLKETGHAVNIDAPKELNDLIKSFILRKKAIV